MHHTKEGSPDRAKQFKVMFEGMRDARKLFRLFKSLVEYQKILVLLKQKQSDYKKVINILSRLSFLCYWVFDNLSILAKIKFLESVDKDKASKWAATFWLLGLFFGILSVLSQFYEVFLEEKNLAVLKKQH
mmetsp:Transcript_41677/g.40045  ORF Transcript_41677/g.40045 Transcript_41677/m.40045 type:complete len:131 (+) Transcript_41677:120-512(+)|eukprot:CAMPEP_0170540522 /NCGR_PEP_ID=MMETSP0211-20121228/508_1 /TAXON_ID=311385 /ORGANISM="Pseudokeronopsis sp., Strain OXSARD2" /LENGTH=130 /DNA_ID=CAMNT_0010842965 /DNA_START=98 /DNA_END=490 /DNA_ORIENTATION=+